MGSIPTPQTIQDDVQFEFVQMAQWNKLNRKVILEAFQMRPEELSSYRSPSSLLSSSDVGVRTRVEFGI